MDLDWLRTFVTAAESENFHRAAERLHLAQPTVTVHIQKLERVVGAPLFDRGARHIRLTAAGHRFLAHARTILGNVDATRADMAQWQQGYEETLTIAVSPLIATTQLPHWVRGFTHVHPEVMFSIQVMESQSVYEHVLSGASDLGLSRAAFVHPHLSSLPLFSDPVVFAVPADQYDLDGPQPTVEELLRQYPVFTHNHPGYWDDLEATLRRKFPAIRTMRVSLVHVTVHWIAEKMGVSFLPTSTIRREVLRGTVIELPFPDSSLPTAQTHLLTLQKPRPVARAFAAYVLAYIGERGY